MDLRKSLVTPPGILVTVALLAIYALYALRQALIWKSPFYLALALLAVIGCIGTALVRPWSRHAVYLLTAGFIVGWLHSIYAGFIAGYFTFAFRSRLDIVRSLAPGLAMVLLSSACSMYVYRHFKTPR